MKGVIGKKRLIILFILLVVSIIFMTLIISTDDRRKVTEAHNGILDLKDWEIKQYESISLSGEWSFYWKRLVSYQEIKNNDGLNVFVKAPSFWNANMLDGKKLTSFGYGSYVLKIINATKGKPISFHIPTFSMAYDIMINDQLYFTSGRVGTSKSEYRPEYNTGIIQFTPEDTSFTLIIHVSNFDNTLGGGMWNTIEMGTPNQIEETSRVIQFRDLILFGAIACIAVYYLCFFLLRREDVSSLYLSLTCIVIAIRMLIFDDCLIRILFPFIGFHSMVSMEYITLCSFSVLSYLFIGSLYPKETNRWIMRIMQAYVGTITVIIVITPVHIFSGQYYILLFIALMIVPYIIFCLCKAFVRRKRGSLLMLVGMFQLGIAGVHDTLYESNVIYSKYGELIPISLFILLFLQAIVLSNMFSQSFEEVRNLSQKLLRLDVMKDEFLANTSHELRTPLNGILGITQALLKGSEGELNRGQRENLTLIAYSSRRLSNLINDILDYSRLKNGNILMDIRPIRIEGLIQTTVNVFRQLNQSKELEIMFEEPESLPYVLADENRVVQILYNLIGNAVKFTDKGYVKLSMNRVGNKLEVCVRDTGEGISKDRIDDIFKPFEQEDSSIIRRYQGVGLGLSITKKLVELLGGQIWVESTPGKGSNFFFTLPVTEIIPEKKDSQPSEIEINYVEQNYAVNKEIKLQTAENKEVSTQILLVDDDAINRQAAMSVLRVNGYGVTAVDSGIAALEEIKRRADYSLVILDVMMPRVSGYEVCKKLRESRTNYELPVLILTAKISISDIVMGFEAGANDYLPKPFEPEELLARVRTLTGLKTSVDKAITAETALMQAQIKPHFLFNTLNTISYFCDTDPGRAQKLIDSFSNYLRYSFDFKTPNMYVPLDHELGLVSSYLEIEKARFGEQLQVEYHIENGIAVKIPLLSIQPLVENAISHGLRKRKGIGTIKISAVRIPEGIRISVEDDGQGIPPEKLDKLLTAQAGRGIGLWNTNRRLKKAYGKGLTIVSTPGIGTTVSFIVTSEVN